MIRSKTIPRWVILMLTSVGLSVASSDRPPYPPSPVIGGIVFHRDTTEPTGLDAHVPGQMDERGR